MSADGRSAIAEAQAQFLGALAARDPSRAPEGFDASRVRAAANALLRKRARAVARAWPALVAALGADFQRRFAAYASAPQPAGGGAIADGRAFVRSLDQRLLPAAARLEVLAVDLRFVEGPRGLTRRRGFVVKVARLRRPSILVFAVRVHRRELWLRVPWLPARAGPLSREPIVHSQ